MARRGWQVAFSVAGLFLASLPASAVTRDIAEVPTLHLTFGESVLSQLTYETYRSPFDELQSRPFNLLHANIRRHPNLGPWPGQEGGYARYVDALIGNNGAANVDNNADSIQGTMIRRETARLAWGLSAAILNGTIESRDASDTSTFADKDGLTGVDLRGGAALQLSDTRTLGMGLRLGVAKSEVTADSFEQGVGGFSGKRTFDQTGITADVGLRQFVGRLASWDARVALGFGSSTQDESSDSLDGAGAVTGRFVSMNDDLRDLSFNASGGYNRLRQDALGETEYRGGLVYSRRELTNSDLSYTVTGGIATPGLTLLGQKPVARMEAFGSARTIFQAGETEMFAGARLAYAKVDGSTRVDAAGTVVNEAIDDSEGRLTVVLGLRQPILKDRLRIVVSGRGDLVRFETATTFDAGSTSDTSSLTAAQYAVGLEAALSNVTLDLAWLAGEEASVVPVPVGIPSGSRRSVQLDRLVFSAAVSW